MNDKIPGLRVFLLVTLSLMLSDSKISCIEAEQMLAEGVATKMYDIYPIYQNFLSKSTLLSVDSYYKKWVGCAEGIEARKYLCDSDNGLQLLVALALNEIH